MRSKLFSVFLDESGNTGSNYLDPNQPFFICGGWILSDSKISVSRKIVRQWENEISSSKHEIKGSNLAKKRKGRKAIVDLCSRLGKVGAIPTYCVMEKNFGLCARYTEAFFDPLYNKSLSKEILEGTELKYSFADDIFGVIQNEIQNFAKAVRSQDRLKVKMELTKIESVLVENKIAGVEYIQQCPHEEAIDYLVSGDSISNAINNTVFLTLISKFELISRIQKVPSYNVYHDRTDAFGKSFRGIKNRLRKGWANYLTDEFLVSIPKGKYRIKSLRFRDSKKEPLVRAADCFLSLMKYYLEHINDEELFRKSEERIGLVLTLGPVLRYVNLIPDPLVSHEIIPTCTGVSILKALGYLRRNK